MSSVFKYGVLDPATGRWLTVGLDGMIAFTSRKPVSLRSFYNDPRAGSEAHAFEILAFIREHAGTGEEIKGTWVNALEHEATRAVVARFRD